MPIWVSAEAVADIVGRDGSLALKVFSIPVYKLKLSYERQTSPAIKIDRRKKSSEIHLTTDESDKSSVVYIAKNSDTSLLGYIDIKNIGFEARVGSLNALTTTLLIGGIRVAFYSAVSFLKSKQLVDIEESFVPEYNAKILKFRLSCILSISAGEVLAGLGAMLKNKIKQSFRRSYDY